jgi:hypothetical protein
MANSRRSNSTHLQRQVVQYLNDLDGRTSVAAIGGFTGINAQTGTTYEFVVSDLPKLTTAENTNPSTYNIADSFATLGQALHVLNVGTGLVTITVAGSDTLASSANTCPQGDAISIVKITPTSWWVVGGTA